MTRVVEEPPITSWPNEDDAWDDVSRGLERLLTQLATERDLLPPR